MRLTTSLRAAACRITLFTRPNCTLCTDAKDVLKQVWQRRPFEYDEINVMDQARVKWKSVYEFDTPVIHADRVQQGDGTFSTTTEAAKLMHRFKSEQVEALMDQVMNH